MASFSDPLQQVRTFSPFGKTGGKEGCPFSRRRRFRSSPQRRGMILFVVTVVIAALTLGGFSLLALMRIELETTRQRLRELTLANTVRSASAMIVSLSRMTPDERAQFGGIYDNPALFCGRSVLSSADGGDDTLFTVLSPRLETERSGLRYGLVNESTRLNLGALLEWDKEEPGLAKSTLMKLPGMTSIMADSILDWIDPDESVRPDGAEASYYAGRHFTYSPRNALPVSLDELLLARGITRYQLYGTDTVCNYSGSAGDKSLSGSDIETGPIGSLRTTAANAVGMKGGAVDTAAESAETEVTIPWTRLLTVFSAERDIDPTGRARIDLNEKDLSFLYDELTAALGEEIAVFVILCRQYGVIPPDGTSVSATAGKEEVDLTTPAKFNFTNPLDLVGARVRLKGNRVFASPVSDRRERSEELFEYLDFASVGTSAVITGRVNINESPRAVLELVPGLDSETVTRILDTRPVLGKPIPKSRRHAAWLYTEGIVDLDHMKKLWGKLTTGGDVFRAQITAFSALSGRFRRAEIAVDASVTPPRQVHYKDLTMFGRGFSHDVLLNRFGGTTENLTSKLDTLIHEQTTPATPFGPLESIPPSDTPFDAVDGMIGE